MTKKLLCFASGAAVCAGAMFLFFLLEPGPGAYRSLLLGFYAVQLAFGALMPIAASYMVGKKNAPILIAVGSAVAVVNLTVCLVLLHTAASLVNCICICGVGLSVYFCMYFCLSYFYCSESNCAESDTDLTPLTQDQIRYPEPTATPPSAQNTTNCNPRPHAAPTIPRPQIRF